jgi:molybdenum cofactor biosynthesis enzyme MoaA
LDKLPAANIYISGGEPFLYKGLPDLINQMPKRHQIIGMVTNASFNTDLYMAIEKKIHLNVSFHREYTDKDSFMDKIDSLRSRFQIAVNIVATP